MTERGIWTRGLLYGVLLALLIYITAWTRFLNAAPVPTGPSASLLVAGKAQPEHAIDGVTYVETTVGTEYAIRLTNPFPRRIGVTLMVDGLNTIDAKEQAGRLWILSPHETAEIPGWQVSGQTARRFVFSEERDSYARSLGRKTTTGVIRATFVEEQRWTSLTIPLHQGQPYAGTLTLPVQGSTYSLTVADAMIGTAQGVRTDHAGTEVAFERGSEIGTVEIRYVTREALARILREPLPTGYCPEVVGAR